MPSPAGDSSLPVRSSLTPVYRLSLVLALLIPAASTAGVLAPEQLFPDEAVRDALLPTDVVTLALVVPLLLVSMELARRGRLLGLLLWPGVLLTAAYNAAAFAVAASRPLQVAGYLVLVALPVLTVVLLARRIDHAAVRDRLQGVVPVRFGAGVLIVLGALFLLRAGEQLVSAATGTVMSAAEVGTAVADLPLAVLLLVGGIALWLRSAVGYAAGAGLLVLTALLFIGLMAFFAVQPLVTTTAFASTDFAVIAAMSLVALLPCALYVRGVVRTGR